MGSPRFPEPPPSVPATDTAKIDEKVAILHAQKDAWLKVTIPERVRYLERCLKGVVQVAREWVAASCKQKGVALGTPGEGDQWIEGPVHTAKNLRYLITALRAGGQPTPPKLTHRADGQVVATVYPATLLDKLMMPLQCELWIEPGKEPTQGAIYRGEGPEEGRVALVLGAGNVSAIGPMDCLTKLFVENEVCVLKMNPVNECTGPMIERAFAPLIDDGYLQVVYGGAEAGKHLTAHDQVGSIHMTGSAATHDAIIWGATDEERAKNKAAGTPVLDKHITSELGAVTPAFVVPGPYTDKELDRVAMDVVSGAIHNAGFECSSVQGILVAKNWSLKDRFVKKLKETFKRAHAQKAYYPGSRARFDAACQAYDGRAEILGEDGEDIVPWTLIGPLSADDDSAYAAQTESFMGVKYLIEIEAEDAESFVKAAVPYANEKMFGTLSCCMYVHPQTEKQKPALIDEMIAELRYGSIGVNVIAGLSFAMGCTTWGAFPGHPLDDIQSGIGTVHNGFLFDHPQKSVVRGPLMLNPKPAWHFDHKTLHELGPKLLKVEESPSLLRIPSLLVSAIRG